MRIYYWIDRYILTSQNPIKRQYLIEEPLISMKLCLSNLINRPIFLNNPLQMKIAWFNSKLQKHMCYDIPLFMNTFLWLIQILLRMSLQFLKFIFEQASELFVKLIKQSPKSANLWCQIKKSLLGQTTNHLIDSKNIFCSNKLMHDSNLHYHI